ncbi:MAG: hypothetical protein J6Q40_06035 [Tidjanibacter sp.]|nr:hypothetical protein [Tidjanibacter sp.]
MARHQILLILLLALLPATLSAQHGNWRNVTSIAFMNTENLYDTTDSPFDGDEEYTPTGVKHWTDKRYRQKLNSIARILDDMSADIVGLAEVENEAVVRDLVMTMKEDYNYIHRTTSDKRGIDIALLYRGDRFIPDYIIQIETSSSREVLYVRGRLLGERIDLLVWHAPSQINEFDSRLEAMQGLYRCADSLRKSSHAARVVVMGDLNATPADEVIRRTFGRRDRWGESDKGWLMPVEGAGSYAFDGRWMLYDNIFVDSKLTDDDSEIEGGVFVKHYMLESGNSHNNERTGYPWRTYSGDEYLGGASDHLPVFVNIRTGKLY